MKLGQFIKQQKILKLFVLGYSEDYILNGKFNLRMDKIRAFFSKTRAFFYFQKKGRVGLASSPSYTPDMKDLQQNNGVVILITK